MKSRISDSIPRAALVTGGARQHAIAQALVEAGFATALHCSPGAEAALLAGVVPLPADLADETQAAGLLDRATAALGPIGVLINAAGTCESDTWDNATRATWDMHIETNLRAPLVLIQQFAKMLPAPHEGVVINLLDQRLHTHLVSYTLSKAALWTLTQTMALALAPRIRVNGIARGGIASGPTSPGDLNSSPEIIARAAIAILALPSMTGQMIVPDGVPPPAA
jgi:NAD(P)-dependent dehydrogenase (short-subunit alcohol dehydrogenase family)